jgi:hypothetical protein
VVLDSPCRSLLEPFMEYLERVETERPDDFLTVVLPEFVPAKWWHHLFHNQRALLIKAALLFKPDVVVTSVPFPPCEIAKGQHRAAVTPTILYATAQESSLTL